LTKTCTSHTIRAGERKAKYFPRTSALFAFNYPVAAASISALRSQIEAHLRGRVPSPFTYRDRNVFELVSTGIPEIDLLTGGLPCGAMTEICGAPSSGRTSLLLAALAERTANGEVCALVDARDSFDPITAQAAEIDLSKLLWVRCQNLDQALRATDLLIQAGGFGMVAVDMCDIPTRTVRQVPLNAWFRFRRAVEDTSTILLLLEQDFHAKTCASLVLRLEMDQTNWQFAVAQPLMAVPTDDASSSFREAPNQPFAKLLRSFSINPDIIRSRIQLPPNNVVEFRDPAAQKADCNNFQLTTTWSCR
jgi:recombination protein RecA